MYRKIVLAILILLVIGFFIMFGNILYGISYLIISNKDIVKVSSKMYCTKNSEFERHLFINAVEKDGYQFKTRYGGWFVFIKNNKELSAGRSTILNKYVIYRFGGD